MIKHLRNLCTLLLLAVASMAWADEVTDVLNNTWTGVSGTSYTAWTNKKATSDAVYAGNTAGGNESIQLRSNNNNSGIVTTTSGGKVKSITIEWNSNTADARVLSVYGKNSAYSSAADLYNTDSQGTSLGEATKSEGTKTITVDGDYQFIGFRSKSGAMYIDKITIVWTKDDNALQKAELAFDPTTATVAIDGTTTVNFTQATDATVTFESADENIATYDNGTITGVNLGTTTITATSEANATYDSGEATLKVNVVGKDQVWAEDFSGDLSAYTLTAGGSETKTYDAALAGGETPELLIGKSGGKFTATIDLKGYYGGMSLTYKANNANNALSTTTEGVTIEEIVANSFYKISVPQGTATLTLVVTNSTNSNTRVDDFELRATDKLDLADPEFSFGETTAFEVYTGDDFTAPTLTYATGFDGTVVYSSSNENVALVDENTGEVVIGEAGTATITTSSVATDNFLPGEASYTITVVDNTPINLAAFLALEDNTKATLELDVAQVVYKNGDNMYVRDGNNAIEFYKSSLEWETGELLSGTLTATKGSNKNNPQATNVTNVKVESAGTEAVTATATTIADAKNHLNDLVEFTFDQFTTNTAGTTYYATDGTNSVQLYDKFKVGYTAPEEGKTYKVKGIMIVYNSTVEICPIEALTEMELQDPEISFSVESLNITKGDSYEAPQFLNPNDLDVTFESDNEEVAMWDDTNNELVLMDDYGTANITATFAGNDTYKPATATLVVTVSAPIVKHTASFSVNGEVTSTADVVEGEAITFPENPADINGKTFVGWTATTIDGTTDKAPEFVTSATMGTEDVTFYAVFANTGGGEATMQTATLTSEQIKDSYNTESNGYMERTFTDGNGKVWNAYAMSYQHSNATKDYYYAQIKKYASNQAYYIQVPEYGTISKLEITVSNSSKAMDGGGNTATLFFSADENTAAEGEGVVSGTGDKEVTLECSLLDLKTGYITASGAVRIWNIVVTYTGSGSYSNYCTTVPAEVITVTISEKAKGKNADNFDRYFGTLYYSNKNLKMKGSNLLAKPVSVEDGKITDVATFQSNQEDVIPAGIAVLLEAMTAGDYEFEVVAEHGNSSYETILNRNMLKGTDEAATIADAGYKYYMLSLNAKGEEGSVGFYWGKDSNEGTQITNGAHKAYLAVPEEVAAGVRGFTFGGDATAIEAIDNSQLTIDNAADAVYNLAGQHVAKAQKGVYIVGGKKVVIR